MISIKASTFYLCMALFSVSALAQTSSATVKTTTTKSSTTTVKAKAAAVAKPATQTVTTKTTTVTKTIPVKSGATKTAPKATSTVKKTTTTAPKTSTGTTAVSTTEPAQNSGGSIKTQTTLPNVNQAPGEQKTVGTKVSTGGTSTTPPAQTGSSNTSGTTTGSGKVKTTGGSGSNTSGSTTTSSGSGSPAGDILSTITEGDASSAIKEALKKGVQVGVDKVSVTDGFFGNAMIKIPFPDQVKQVESALRSVGMGSLIDNAVLSMNRAAESAAKQAGPIFLNSITQMTVTDAVNIVSNQQPDAATQFLKRTTTESLVSSFKPSIKAALDATLATKYWGDITGYYNKLPFVSPVNTDLPDYVTRKAIDGLFYMVAQEEAKIRKDPAGSASKVVSDVFSKVKSKF